MRGPDPRTLTRIPPMVSFASGAELLIRLRIAPNMTREGVRRASSHPDWPFGPDRPHPYWEIANADLMETEPFLAFWRANPPIGRGPDKNPRNKTGDE